jgi:hypothetical protein
MGKSAGFATTVRYYENHVARNFDIQLSKV